MQEIKGDILEIQSGIICHQANCMGVVGGLAGALHRKYPLAFTQYFLACSLDPMMTETPGDIVLGVATMNPKLIIFHMLGQTKPGPNTDMGLVEHAFIKLRRAITTPSAQALPIYIPYKMGCGLGGGDWNEYKKVIEKYFPEAIIVKKYEN